MNRRVPQHKPPSFGPPAATHRTPDRLADNRFYASKPWLNVRRCKLAENPTCERCEKEGRVTPATEVHHIKERKLSPDLALDFDNLMSLCHACHLGMRRRC